MRDDPPGKICFRRRSKRRKSKVKRLILPPLIAKRSADLHKQFELSFATPIKVTIQQKCALQQFQNITQFHYELDSLKKTDGLL
jgi:hypothetical protein